MVIQLHNNDITNLLDLQGVLVNKKIFSKDLIELWISCPIKVHVCPRCGNTTSRVHDYYERSFSHIIVNKQETLIHYNSRRYVCTKCGKRFAESNLFVEKFYRHSNAVVNNVFDELTNINSFSNIGKHTGMSGQMLLD